MPTVTLTVSEYNALRLRTALAVHRNAQNGGGERGPRARVSVPVSTLARDAEMLELEEGRTMAGPSTTQAALPQDAVRLCPARDPVNAGRTVRVEWAGRCHGCQAPIWAATWPGTRHQTPRRCPGCGGAPVFRVWQVPQGPESPLSATDPRMNGDIPGCNGDPLADPPEQRKSDTGFVTPRNPPRAPRGGRPRIYPEPAARQRAYRDRRRSKESRPSPVAGSPSVRSGRAAS
jgi:hypothetical protein